MLNEKLLPTKRFIPQWCALIQLVPMIQYDCCLAVKHDLGIDQIDAVTAFLQGDLGDEIYMMQPEGLRSIIIMCIYY